MRWCSCSSASTTPSLRAACRDASSAGRHDVPAEKLSARFPRTMKNLARAIEKASHVLVFDNSNLANPFRKVAEFERGQSVVANAPVPRWLPLKRKRGRGRRR